MSSATQVRLTSSDSTTLHKIFDPESSPSPDAPLVDPALPPSPHYPPAETSALAATEREAIALSTRDLSGAFALLSTLVSSHPLYASAYNNRAQMRRLRNDAPAEVLPDLDRAIELAAPTGPAEAVSREAARVLGMAYTQKGAVLLEMARAGGGAEMEEAAARQFALGGRWGNDLGKKLGRELNPYARLCGAIVKEALKKEYVGGE